MGIADAMQGLAGSPIQASCRAHSLLGVGHLGVSSKLRNRSRLDRSRSGGDHTMREGYSAMCQGPYDTPVGQTQEIAPIAAPPTPPAILNPTLFVTQCAYRAVPGWP